MGTILKSIAYAVVTLLAVAAASFVFIITTKLYPVVIVDGSPIWLYTWEKTEEVAKTFANSQRKATGEGPIDFSKPANADLLFNVKRDTLTFLIEDRIIAQEGNKLADDFESMSVEQADKAVRESKGGSLKEASQEVYGLEFENFRRIVLLPQARRDLIQKLLSQRGRNFQEWLFEMKISKSVRPFFVPFRWGGGKLEKK